MRKMERDRKLFYFLFFYIICLLLRYKKSHGAQAMPKTKHKIKNKQTKETSITDQHQRGSILVPGPRTGAKITTSKARKPCYQAADITDILPRKLR